VKKRCKTICFTCDEEDGVGFSIDGIYSRGFCKPRMWAQYADNHSGVCLVFDWVKIGESIRNAFREEKLVFEGHILFWFSVNWRIPSFELVYTNGGIHHAKKAA